MTALTFPLKIVIYDKFFCFLLFNGNYSLLFMGQQPVQAQKLHYYSSLHLTIIIYFDGYTQLEDRIVISVKWEDQLDKCSSFDFEERIDACKQLQDKIKALKKFEDQIEALAYMEDCW